MTRKEIFDRELMEKYRDNRRPLVYIRHFDKEIANLVRDGRDVSRLERILGALTVQYDASAEDVVNYVKREYKQDFDELKRACEECKTVTEELYATPVTATTRRPKIVERCNSVFRRFRLLFHEFTLELIDNEFRLTQFDWPWHTLENK